MFRVTPAIALILILYISPSAYSFLPCGLYRTSIVKRPLCCVKGEKEYNEELRRERGDEEIDRRGQKRRRLKDLFKKGIPGRRSVVSSSSSIDNNNSSDSNDSNSMAGAVPTLAEEPLSLYQAAYLSYRLRHTAKLYARYRCNLPGRVLTEVYDGFRHWREYGVWKAEGRGWEETWERYEDMDKGGEEGKVDRVAMMVLEGSCRTNEFVDGVTMGRRGGGIRGLSVDGKGRELSVGEELVVMLAGEKRMTGEEFGRVRERIVKMNAEKRTRRKRERIEKRTWKMRD
ncbi:hypothetical protein TrCOL_g3811 [Triparma columacea]|uniref:Uncharacterized protein n=1 Tax=Triparma columacea TaxID=722753 RepID=A0A9W7L9P9_9STRA|nr:hypothetical protein TrCOL_g3811 [Triparma columacea]